MIIEQSLHPSWLSNTWLIAPGAGSTALLVDSGGPPEPILAAIEKHSLTLAAVLCTHHHHDHVQHNALYRDKLGADILCHPSERELIPSATGTLVDGDLREFGLLSVEVLHIPGHTRGQLAFSVAGVGVFTGDTLFKGSVGGTCAPAHTTFDDLRTSIMDRLMTLAPETVIYPGHTESSSIGLEWETNPFIRMWRGLDAPGEAPCQAFGRAATLRLRAPDYDGGTKCWVTFADGQDDVVPGSRVVDG